MTDSVARLGGLHRGLVADAEGAADGGPGVAGGAGFCDEFSAACGHRVHPRLECGEGFEDVVGHTLTVTGVAGYLQLCNYGCRHVERIGTMNETDRDEERTMTERICTLKTLGTCDGYHGARSCDACVSDGNRDDPTYAYCGYPAGHAGAHGHWVI